MGRLWSTVHSCAMLRRPVNKANNLPFIFEERETTSSMICYGAAQLGASEVAERACAI